MPVTNIMMACSYKLPKKPIMFINLLNISIYNTYNTYNTQENGELSICF